mgnify:CR=1 FL=1
MKEGFNVRASKHHFGERNTREKRKTRTQYLGKGIQLGTPKGAPRLFDIILGQSNF